MKRITIATLVLGLALSACAGGTTVGADFDDVGTDIEESKSPAPKVSKPPKNKVEKEEPKEEPLPKGDTIRMRITSSANGFEWRHPDLDQWISVSQLGGPSVFPGDKIVFTNEDPAQHTKHGLQNMRRGGVAEGEVFDTGELASGAKTTIKIDFDFGEYLYGDPGVPYLVDQGPLCVYDPDNPTRKVGEVCDPNA